MPAVGPVGPAAHPSSCQRARSASAAGGEALVVTPEAFVALAVLGLHQDQTGVHTSPRGGQAAWRSSARCLAAKATGPLWCTGGSKAQAGRPARAGGDGRRGGGRQPGAARWARRPRDRSGPARRPLAGGQLAEGAEAEAGQQLGQLAGRQAPGRPAPRPEGGEEGRRAPPGTTAARHAPPGRPRPPAARVAAKRPSATPTPGRRPPDPAASTAVTPSATGAARAASPPW